MSAERDRARKLGAAVRLCPRLEVAEALLAGLPVPADRLDQHFVGRLGLVGDVVLSAELALRVVAAGPIKGTT